MARFDPFPSVSSRYGAPMGRHGRPLIPDAEDWPRLCARHQGGGEGYDKGGAYWGCPRNVWAVWVWGQGPDTVVYVRAGTRRGAMAAAIGLPSPFYTMAREHCGEDKPRVVVRHHGEFIASADDFTDAVMLACENEEKGK